MDITPFKEIYWINTIKCMLSVYLIHSQAYYGFGDLEYGIVLLPFYVNAFFFISGFLFFSKQISTPIKRIGSKQHIFQLMENVFFRLIVPTIIFSSLIYIPKNLFHDNHMSWGIYFYEVFGGISFWFTSALTIVQFVFIILLISNKKNIWFYFCISLIISIIAILFNNHHRFGNVSTYYFPWYYKTGLAYTLIYSLGGIYSKYETHIDKLIRRKTPLFLIAYILLLYLGKDLNLVFLSMSGQTNILGLFEILISFTLVVAFAKSFPPFQIVNFIGRKSIILYFFSGTYPAFISQIAIHQFPNPCYLITIIVAVTAFALALFTTWIINQYLPFLIDIRVIGMKRKKINHE